MFLEIQKFHFPMNFALLCGTYVYFETGKNAEYMKRDMKFSD